MAGRAKQPIPTDPATLAYLAGIERLSRHVVFKRMIGAVRLRRDRSTKELPGLALVEISASKHSAWATILVNSSRRAEPEEWEWALGHAVCHLAFDHVKPMPDADAWRAASCTAVTRFQVGMRVGSPPVWARPPEAIPSQPELVLYRRFLQNGVPENLRHLGTMESGPDVRFSSAQVAEDFRNNARYTRMFGEAVTEAVAQAVTEAGTRREPRENSAPARALRWMIDSYPLLSALAAGFRLIEDPDVCRRQDIGIAAVNPSLREVYVNPVAGFGDDEWRFVLAHELLHVALDHAGRLGDREAELWNVACDFAINQWLIAMRVGTPPRRGLLYDATLADLSAEAIYDKVAVMGRRWRRMLTLRGAAGGDLVGGAEPTDPFTDADTWVKQALASGLHYHELSGRGYLPGGLVEEIHALLHPPIAWDAKLAIWFQEHIKLAERRRTYTRISRRQSSTPNIPRPGTTDIDISEAPTFGVILDTSGSMSRRMIAMCLGAIAAYATDRGVPVCRLVECDAFPYDAGWVRPEDLRRDVEVHGRGGTVIQPAVDLYAKMHDFPADGPILVLTDGFVEESLRIPREHAFLMPRNARLPFEPRGEVFAFED